MESTEQHSIAPTAKSEIHSDLFLDLLTDRHSSDGAGTVRWTSETEPVLAGQSGRYRITYEAGPEGIAVGGAVFFIPSPFWGWSRPQSTNPELPGFTVVETAAPGVELEIYSSDRQTLVALIRGRALKGGETLHWTYGAGERGATVDRYAERAARLWLAVDGDGDGVRAILPGSPAVSITAGPPAQIVPTLPSTARMGETVQLTVAVLDAVGNAGVDYSGEISLTPSRAGANVPATLLIEQESRGVATATCAFSEAGTYRISLRSDDGLAAVSNPIVVSDNGTPIYWGDLHGHSSLSDGTGTPHDYLAYARDVAKLDIVAITDHDHWGILFLDQNPSLWQRICERTEEFHDPGRFVTLAGFEWTNWLHGHRHVLYFDDPGPVLSSVDPRFDTPDELWSALKNLNTLTVAHHSAGGPIATNWDYSPDPSLEPVIEIVSVHGSSEAPDSTFPIYNPVEGNFVRDALDRGTILGFIGSGDSHDGHPGLTHLVTGNGGLAAILASDLTRAGVRKALVSRRAYATNGPRIVLRFAIGGQPMGSIISPSTQPVSAFISASACGPIKRLDLINSGDVHRIVEGEGRKDLQVSLEFDQLRSGEYFYTRVIQQDGGAAWSSPIFVR